MQIFKAIFRNKSGATAIEYCLLASLFAIICIAAIFILHDQIIAMYDGLEDSVVSANSTVQ